MWSIQKLDQHEPEEKSSDSDVQKTTIKMFRIKLTTVPVTVDNEEEEDPSKGIEEQVFKFKIKEIKLKQISLKI